MNSSRKIVIDTTFDIIHKNNTYVDVWKSKSVIKFNHNNQEVELSDYYLNGKVRTREISLYDSDNGKIIEKLHFDYEDDIPYLNYKKEYEYDSNNNLIKTISPSSETIFNYNDNNLLLEETEWITDSYEKEIFREKKFDYDEKNNLIEYKDYTHHSEFSIPVLNHSFYKYDEENNKIHTSYSDGRKNYNYQYKYDDNKNMIEEYSLGLSGSPNLLNKRSYDKENRLILRKDYENNNIVRILEIDYDSNSIISTTYNMKDGTKTPEWKHIKETKRTTMNN